MIKEHKRFLTPINSLVLISFVGFSIYIYYGFFFNNPVIFLLFPFTIYILLIVKIFYPIIVLSVIYFYRAIYLKKVEIGSVVVLSFTIFFSLLLLYPIGDYFYRNSLNVNLKEYHPYLQLNPSLFQEYDSTKYNIFCLGGSTTEFKDEKGRDWPGMVQKELNKEPIFKGKIRLHNLGKQWYTSQHILINYLINLKQYKPDMILVMENINDLLHNADFSWLSKGKYRADYGNFLGPLTRLVKYQSFVQFLKTVLSELWYSNQEMEIEENEFPGIYAFERNLKNLIILAKSDDTKIVLMTQPNIYKTSMSVQELNSLVMLNGEAIGNGKKWNSENVLKGFQIYNDKIRELSQLNDDTYFLDLEKIVPKTLEYFIDDVHYTSKSHDLIAHYITGELKRIIAH